MRKQVFGRKLKRDTNERKALFKGLLSALVLHGRIETTEEKAKAIRAQAEKLVTKVKKKGQNSMNLVREYLHAEAVKKLVSDVALRFGSRNGGYTRIIKLGNRFSDNASMVIMEWTETSQKLAVSTQDLRKKEIRKEKVKPVKKAPAKKPAKKKETKIK